MKVKATLPVLWCRDLTSPETNHDEIGTVTVDIDIPPGTDLISSSVLCNIPRLLADLFPPGRDRPLSIIIGPPKED